MPLYKEILSYNLFYDYFFRLSKKNDIELIMAIHGAFMMFDKKKIEKVGFFDQDFSCIRKNLNGVIEFSKMDSN